MTCSRIERRLVGVAEDFSAGVDELAERRLGLHNLGIVHGIGRVWYRMHHLSQVGWAADRFQVARLTQPLQKQGGIDTHPVVVHREQVGVEFFVLVRVEIVVAEQEGNIVA